MTITTTTTGTTHSTHIADPVAGRRAVQAVADALLHAMTEAGLDSPRWESAGPLVSAAAHRLREALGTPVVEGGVHVPPVVREADFARAARPLLADAPIVDTAAAHDFATLATDARLALG